MEKKLCCCTRKQLLIALGTVATSVFAGVASVLVKNFMEHKQHTDEPVFVSAIEHCVHAHCRCATPAACLFFPLHSGFRRSP